LCGIGEEKRKTDQITGRLPDSPLVCWGQELTSTNLGSERPAANRTWRHVGTVWPLLLRHAMGVLPLNI